MNRIRIDAFWKLSQFIRNGWSLSRKLSVCFLASFGVLVCLILFPAIADEAENVEKKDDEAVQQTEKKPVDSVKATESSPAETPLDKDDKEGPDNNTPLPEPTKEVIVGDADNMDRNQKTGVTILTGNVKTVRLNEQGVEIGFLNADKVTLKGDPETGQTVEIIAVGNVEIRDQDIFATCDHATMNNLTNTITLKENVVVLQNKDRLETKLFTFNRTTGKQTGVGGVKFKVTVTQATPTETSDEADEAGPDKKEDEAKPSKDGNTDTPTETDKGDNEKPVTDSDKTDPEEKRTPSETEKDSTESESEKDKKSESEKTEPAESEASEPTEDEADETTEDETDETTEVPEGE